MKIPAVPVFLLLLSSGCLPRRSGTISSAEERYVLRTAPITSVSYPPRSRVRCSTPRPASGTPVRRSLKCPPSRRETRGSGIFSAAISNIPPGARSERITGTVILELTVEEGGILEEIGVSGSAHPLLDEEAVRVLRLSPEWKRGREPGVPLPFTIRMPITFKLSGF